MRRALLAWAGIPLLAGAAPAPGAVHLTYAVFVHGMRAMSLDATLRFDGDRYVVTTATRPAGFLGSFVSSHVSSRAEGTIENGAAHPDGYSSVGFSRGANRQTEMSYAGGNPVVRVLTPPEPNRDPVPAAQTAGTVDGLSAMAALLGDMWRSGRCDGSTRVFDGARLSEVTARTAGTVTLPQTGRSPYSGPTVQCDFTSQETGGFLHDGNFAASHQPQIGHAWLANAVAGVGPVPIRADFTTVDHGQISLFLTRAEQ